MRKLSTIDAYIYLKKCSRLRG